ncbi:MAG: Leucine-rich repeat (LRR) protein [Halioglobus sp.]|jgi:Leucine-rich repeat (LRR) protein
MMLHRIFYLSIMIAVAHLTACESYDFTVNEKRVYTAKPLFSDFQVSDEALYNCLKQNIVDFKITTAGELSSLNCAHAGISDLQGLASFSGLIKLKLSSNSIHNLSELSLMSSLEELYIGNNVIIDSVPLFQLPDLKLLDLSNNTQLRCPPKQAFAHLTSLTLPLHCE